VTFGVALEDPHDLLHNFAQDMTMSGSPQEMRNCQQPHLSSLPQHFRNDRSPLSALSLSWPPIFVSVSSGT
jgi:hypothetical protein